MDTEILENYKYPKPYIWLYENFNTVESNSELTIINLGDELEAVLREVLEIYSINLGKDKENIHDNFCKDKRFVKLFVVIVFITDSSWGTRRSDHFNKKIEYCLYHKGIRVTDEYIEEILPKEKNFNESYYNDSTSGEVASKDSKYYISQLETERFLERYNLDDHCNFIAENLEVEKFEFGKVEMQTVYHEFGHLFGYLICEKLGYNLGTIQEIALKQSSFKNKSTQFKIDNNWYSHIKGLSNQEKELEIKRIKQNLNGDKKKLFSYISYVLFGGVFNIWFFKIKPKYEDFEAIYKHDTDEIKYGNLNSRAGDDLKKISEYRFDLNWENYDFQKFKYLAYEVFYVLDKHLIFFHLDKKHWLNLDKSSGLFKSLEDKNHKDHSLIEIFELIFNGKITRDEVLINSYLDLLEKSISTKTIENLTREMSLLIDKYVQDTL